MHGVDDWESRRLATRDNQGGFRQSVAGVERRVAKTARREGPGKPLQGLWTDRLCPVEGHFPTAQIQRGPLLGRDLACAQIIGKVGTNANAGSRAGDGLQPAERPLQKGHGRHKNTGAAHIQGVENHTNQPHIVVQGQPPNNGGMCCLRRGLLQHGDIGEQIRMAEHHTLGRAGRPGGILQKGQGAARNPWLLPGLFQVVCQGIRGQPPQGVQCWRLGEPLACLR